MLVRKIRLHGPASIGTVLCLLSLCIAFPARAQNNQPAPLSNRKIGEVLSCLQTKLAPDDAPPKYSSGLYRVRYFYGTLTPGDEEADELQLVAYAPKERTAVLYRVYLDKENGKPELFIGDWGTLKREHGRMETDELPGGIATYYEIKKLLRVLSRRPPVTIKNAEVKPGPAACVYEP